MKGKATSNILLVKSQIISITLKVIIGLILLVVAHILGSRTAVNLIRLNEKRKTETVALVALSKVVYVSMMIIAVLLILRIFGLEIASIIAIISACAFVVGMSLQGTLSDIASGFMLAIFQTYNIGDVIEVKTDHDTSIFGKVLEFRMVNTIIEDLNSGLRVTVPNRKIQESIVMNYSATKFHMVIIDILTSNRENKDFNFIVEALRKDLDNRDYYPDIVYSEGDGDREKWKVRVFIYDMSEVGTTIRILAPITNDAILSKRAAIRTRVRDVLAKNNVMLVDPF